MDRDLKSPVDITALVIRVFLGAWFTGSGGWKIFVTGLDRFILDVANYQLVGPPLDIIAAYIVPWVEIVGGICLMLGILRKGTLLAMTGLVITFCVAIGSAWAKNLDISCGCHGGDAKLNYWWKATELAGYLIAFAYLAWIEVRRPLRNR